MNPISIFGIVKTSIEILIKKSILTPSKSWMENGKSALY